MTIEIGKRYHAERLSLFSGPPAPPSAEIHLLRRGAVHDYEDEAENRRILDRVAEKCYLPAGALLLELIEDTTANSGSPSPSPGCSSTSWNATARMFWRAFRGWPPRDASSSSTKPTATRSPSSFRAPDFQKQVLQHQKGARPLRSGGRTFRHTELIYSNDLARAVEELGYRTILAEGADKMLGRRSPNYVYHPAGCKNLKLLLRNYRSRTTWPSGSPTGTGQNTRSRRKNTPTGSTGSTGTRR